jgi:hypothetical protein
MLPKHKTLPILTNINALSRPCNMTILPVVALDHKTVNHIQDIVYPKRYPSHTTTTTSSTHRTQSKTQHKRCTALTVQPKQLLKALCSIKKGTATGPFADYTDFLQNFALYEHKTDTKSSS